VIWDKFLVAESDAHPQLVGRSVAGIARERGCTEVDVLCELSLAENLGTRFLATLGNYEEGPVTELMLQEGAVFGQSDAGAHVAQLCDANMPTELLAHWVRGRGALTLEHAVHKLTAELADLFGLDDRGRLAPGAAADIVVFDPETVDPGPLRRVRDLPGNEERLIAAEPTGIDHILVNGVAITSHGESRAATMTDRPGHVLRARKDNSR
jgi:N-acyl-D-aspartate/D-glutamate deacylase